MKLTREKARKIIRVLEHAQHDQDTHGNWARGGNLLTPGDEKGLITQLNKKSKLSQVELDEVGQRMVIDIAKGILLARYQLGITVPIIIRLIGTNEERGRNMLNEAGLIVTRYMTDAIQDAVNCAREGSKP